MAPPLAAPQGCGVGFDTESGIQIRPPLSHYSHKTHRVSGEIRTMIDPWKRIWGGLVEDDYETSHTYQCGFFPAEYCEFEDM